LPATESTASFPVSWSGQDDPDGSGVAAYNVYVSDNGGPFTLWQSATTQTSAIFTGVNQHTYAFYSVAIDNVGNEQPMPSVAEATTQIKASTVNTMTVVQTSENPASVGDSVSFTATVSASSGATLPSGDVQFSIGGTQIGPPVAVANGIATSIPVSFSAAGNYAVTAAFSDPSLVYNSSAATLSGGEVVHATGTTKIVVTSSLPGSVYGQSLTFTASVSPEVAGSPSPTGTIQFVVDGTNLGLPVSLTGGSATSVAIGNLGAGTHTVAVDYSGDINYALNTGSFSQTVKKAYLTVTANNAAMVYGGAVPRLSATITGFVNNDRASVVSGAASLSTAATPLSRVGTYSITVGAGSLAAANYDFVNLVAGRLLVTPAPLTIAVNDASRLVDQPNPPFTVSYFGFVNGDGPSSLKSPPSLSTKATTSSPAGVYPITVSGASSPNYTITFIGGTLTVISPPLVTMTGVVDKTNKRHQVTEIVVTFSGAVNVAEADSINTYRLATPGKKGSYTAKNAGIIKLKSAVYNGSSDTVALTPKEPFALTKPVQFLVYGTGASGLQDAEGRLIDGDHNGTPGGNAVAILSKNSVIIDAVEQAQTQAAQLTSAAVVDALLAKGELADLRRTLRARPEGRLARHGA
jgi:MBG domain (YGX type)/Bacterial Ig-like domain (group 3)